MIRISVIIPTYEPGSYIGDAFNSLIEQSIDLELVEIIVVLNGPRDPFFTFINQWGSYFKNFRLIYSPDAGVSRARNIGIDHALGKFICFLDDDDCYSSNYLQTMHDLADKIDDFSVLIQSNFIARKGGINQKDYISTAFNNLSGVKYSLFKYRKFLSNVGGKLYHRDLIGMKRFNTELKIAEDAVFLFEISNNIKKIELTEKSTTYFRTIREGSVLRRKRSFHEITTNFKKKIKSYYNVYSSDFSRYSFSFFCTRLLASTKMYMNELLQNRNY